LFDENAASHIALGQAYSTCLIGGEKMTAQELESRGANSSLIHVDWMIGSSTIDVNGISVDAEGTETRQPLMRKGEWV
jgi:aminopeptidase